MPKHDPVSLLARIAFVPIHLLFGGMMILMTLLMPARRHD
jgi:hypothetical protein